MSQNNFSSYLKLEKKNKFKRSCVKTLVEKLPHREDEGGEVRASAQGFRMPWTSPNMVAHLKNQPRALSYLLSWPFKSHQSLKSSTNRWSTLKQKDLIDSPLTRRMWKHQQLSCLWFVQTLPIPSQCLTVSGTLRKKLNTVASNSNVFGAFRAYEH